MRTVDSRRCAGPPGHGLDNTTVDADGGSAVLLDWAYAAAGAPWIDLARLAADVVATGHAVGQQAATDRAYRLAGMWCIRAGRSRCF
jgi:aminoglycoside phosphotransferase (APT) family kinase protein